MTRAEIAAAQDTAPQRLAPLRSAPLPFLQAAPRGAGEVETALIGRVIWRRRKAIALATALAVLGAFGYGLISTPQFTAVTQILVDPRDKQVVSNDVNPSSIAADGGVTQVESQASVLVSSGVLLRAIAATHLTDDPEFNGSGLFTAISRLWASPSGEAGRLRAETLQNLRKRTRVTRADKALVLDLSVRAADPDRAAEIANAIARAYLADQADARSSAGRQASEALSRRLGELQGDALRAANAVADYKANHDFVVSTGLLVSDQELNQTAAELSAAQNRAASLRSQLDQLRRAPGAQGTPEAMNSGVMVRLRDRESAVVEKLASAQKQLGPLHPDIASLKQSLADVRALIAAEIERLREAAAADYARAADDVAGIETKLRTMKTRSLDNDKADVRLRELQAQADSSRALYQSFLNRSRETMEAANVDTTNARIITAALPPLQKSWPPTLLLAFGAGVAAFSLAAGGALAYEYARPTLLAPSQAREWLGAPVLGTAPVAELTPDAHARRAADALVARLLRALGATSSGDAQALGCCLYLASAPADAPLRRALADRIAARAATETPGVVVIDADLAGAEESGRSGLLDWLRGDATAADLAYRQEGEKFDRLAPGGGDPLIQPQRCQNDGFRLRRLRRQYDLIVLEGPLSDNARMAALAAEADYVAVVAVLGEPQAGLAREAEAAAEAEVRLDGVALIDGLAA